MPTPYLDEMEHGRHPPPSPPMDHYPAPHVPYGPYGNPYGMPPPPPPPRVARKAGKNIIWWPTDEGSLASRSIGKVNIDCRLRLSESKWGVLEGKQPAGILYVDLTFDQPARCRLSSATVLISLEQYDEDDNRKDREKDDKDEITLSRLRVCEFGPKLLTGEPTTLKRRTEYSFTPEVNAGVGGFGGLGVKRQNSINYVSRWVLKGNTLAPADKKLKTPGIVYRTLKWELTENELAYQPAERSVVHTAFAFEHELKRFYIKVEISGKLKDAVDRLKHRVFPPRLKKHQGTLSTLVDLGAEDEVRKENLDHLARKLEDQMREKNLVAMKKLATSGEEQKEEINTSAELSGGVDLADLAKATEKFGPVPKREPDSPERPSLHPGIYSTPTPSFSSMATTLVPPQSEEVKLQVPQVQAAAHSHSEPHTQGEKLDQNPNPTVNNSQTAGETDSDTVKTSVQKEDEELKPSTKTCEEEGPEDLKLKKAEEKAVKVIAAELQFIEVLIMLRAWVYATFLAMFLRSEQSRRKAILGDEKGRKVS